MLIFSICCCISCRASSHEHGKNSYFHTIAQRGGSDPQVFNQTIPIKTFSNRTRDAKPAFDDHQDCVDHINKYRTSAGLQPLQRNWDAEACVDWQADFDFNHPNEEHRCCNYWGFCTEDWEIECIHHPSSQYITDCIDEMMTKIIYVYYKDVILGDWRYVACGFGGDDYEWTSAIDFWK